MKLDCIISLANRPVRLRFLAMERSLRATGCELPIFVIPYDDNLFDLPTNSSWLPNPEMATWLASFGNVKSNMMRKYICLLMKNYQFVDADICFLRNPEQVLEPYSGFITSCGHWNNYQETVSAESYRMMKSKNTMFQSNVFNAGQFACDQALYDWETLKRTAERPDFVGSCLKAPFNDQTGMNLLVWNTGIEVTNLTLPPARMESTWPGDYPGEYEHYWADEARKPYLIHWAGIQMHEPRPINDIFLQFLTKEERVEWDAEVQRVAAKRAKSARSVRSMARKSKHALLAAKDVLS